MVRKCAEDSGIYGSASGVCVCLCLWKAISNAGMSDSFRIV